MSKSKKHKIARLTDEQYVDYITRLKNESGNRSGGESRENAPAAPRKTDGQNG